MEWIIGCILALLITWAMIIKSKRLENLVFLGYEL